MDAVVLPSGCRWVAAPHERAGQSVEAWNLSHMLGFSASRIFWLIGAGPNEWHGRDVYRRLTVAALAVEGSCELELNDGRQKRKVELRDDGPALIVGPMIWHELFNFSSDATVVVVTSSRDDETEYVRDYASFIEVARQGAN